MATKFIKGGKSKYRYVKKLMVNDKVYWILSLTGVSQKCYETEREAALVVDKYLINKGKEPVNILKRK
jgi:hypothetical protein